MSAKLHPAARCHEVAGSGANNRFSSSPGGASWSFQFECPTCGRTGRFNTNYLGRRVVVCDGVRFSRVPFDLRMAISEHDASTPQAQP